MNMNTDKIGELKNQYAGCFGTDDDQQHFARMLMYRFLSEVERITDERNILRKDLAAMIGVSPSYITQLYRGSKPLNFDTLSKIETALGFRFEVRAVTRELPEGRDNAGSTRSVASRRVSPARSAGKANVLRRVRV